MRPPGYFVFLAGFRLGFEDWVLAAKLAQCALGTAVAFPAFRLARRFAGERAALAAAAFVCLDPTLIAYCQLLFPETVYLFLVSWIFAATLPSRVGAAAGLGALSGLAMLLKPVFGLYPLCLAAGWLWRFGLARGAALASAFGLAAALVLAPWAIRNLALYGPPVLLDNQAAYNLWIGNDPRPAESVLEEWTQLPEDPALRSRVASERGRAAILADPGAFLANAALRVLNLWGAEFFVLRNLIFGAYGEVAPAVVAAAFWILNLAWFGILVLAAGGARRIWRHAELRPPLLYAALFSAVVAALVTTTRFRVPFALPLALCAGAGFAALRERALSRGDRLAMFGAGLLLLLSIARPPFAPIAVGAFASVAELRQSGWFFFRY